MPFGPDDKEYLIKYLLQLQQGDKGASLTGAGNPDFDLLAHRYPQASQAVNVGMGQREMTPELRDSLNVGQSFGGAPEPGIPISDLMKDMAGGDLGGSEMDALRRLLSIKLHELAQQKIQRGF